MTDLFGSLESEKRLDPNVLTLNVTAKSKHMPAFFRRDVMHVELTLKLHSCNDSASTTCSCEALNVLNNSLQVVYLGIIVYCNLSWAPRMFCILKNY